MPKPHSDSRLLFCREKCCFPSTTKKYFTLWYTKTLFFFGSTEKHKKQRGKFPTNPWVPQTQGKVNFLSLSGQLVIGKNPAFLRSTKTPIQKRRCFTGVLHDFWGGNKKSSCEIFCWELKKTKKNTLLLERQKSGQIIIFHQPGFPWNSRGFPFLNATFWGENSCEVTIIWPEK